MDYSRKLVLLLLQLAFLATLEALQDHTITKAETPGSSKLSVPCGLFNNISGLVHRSSRIIGGREAFIEEFPWHASLQKFRIMLPVPIPDWRHTCGASIIGSEWLLTAAHCVDGLVNSVFPGQLRVVIGTDRWRFTLLQSKIQMLPVKRIVIHPDWNSRKAQNDIALIQTTKSIAFDDKSRPICLPDSGEYTVSAGQLLTVAGYGYTTDNMIINVLPDRLQSVKVPVVPTDKCRKVYNITRVPITERMICAGVTTYGRCSGAMKGDSGSALISYVEGHAVHTGIVSFSLPCRVWGAPDVYTRTASYLPWIQSVIQR